ncbi:MAG: YihY/virulence factor BrkB family protein [Flavobacteriales bacterium]|nr:YihY/virulence factor BrkB family protein [Flavobacteriales bacterium]
MGEQPWEQWIRRTPLRRLLVLPLERLHPWGFQGMSAWDVFRFFVVGVAEGALGIRAAAIAFQVFVAIFPVILVLLSLLPLVPVADFQESLFDALRTYFPGDTFRLVESTVADLLATGVHPEIASLGFLLMLFYASSSINGILSGLNEAHHLDRRGNWLLLRAMSILLMVVFSLFLIVAVLLIVFSGTVLDWLTAQGLLALEDLPLIQLIRWLVTLALLFTTITALYNAADFSKDRWRFITPGAVATTFLIVVTSIAFAWFATSLSSYNKLYGSLGTLLLLLVWLNLNCFLLIIGFDLNTALNKARKGPPKSEIEGDQPPMPATH